MLPASRWSTERQLFAQAASRKGFCSIIGFQLFFSTFDSQVWIGEKECRPYIVAPMPEPDWLTPLMLQNSPTNEPDLK